jgi:MOSC domain-containing protein YiiM
LPLEVFDLDPDTGTQDARVLKTAVRLNQNNAGIYGTVVQTGTIRVGDPVRIVLNGRG